MFMQHAAIMLHLMVQNVLFLIQLRYLDTDFMLIWTEMGICDVFLNQYFFLLD